MTVEQLLAINDGVACDILRNGQTICVPDRVKRVGRGTHSRQEMCILSALDDDIQFTLVQVAIARSLCK